MKITATPTLLLMLFPLLVQAMDVQVAASSTYRVYSLARDGSIHTGSGVQTGANRVLTNCHVIADTREVVVEYAPNGKKYKASGVSTDQGRDTCVLEVPGAPGKTITQARFVSRGDIVHVLGYPQSSRLVASTGTVLEPEFKLNQDIAIHTSNYCAPGASGGPLLNDAGELAGLIFAGNTRDHTCLAIPAYYLKRAQSGSFAPFSTGAPVVSKGSVYHDHWRN